MCGGGAGWVADRRARRHSTDAVSVGSAGDVQDNPGASGR